MGILIIFGIAWMIVEFRADRIRDIVVRELNSYLAVEVKVSRIGFDFWSNFPDVSLKFNDVVIEKEAEKINPLLRGREISVLFSIPDIYFSDYTIKDIHARDIFLDLNDDSESLKIFSSAGSEEGASSAPVDLQNITVQNLHLAYRNKNGRVSFQARADRIGFNGNNATGNWECRIQGDWKVDHLQVRDGIYFADMDAETEANLVWYTKNRKLVFEEGEINIEGIKLLFTGSLGFDDNDTGIDMEFVTQKEPVNGLMRLVPEKRLHFRDAVGLDGILSLRTIVTGSWNSRSAPEMTVGFSLNRGVIEWKAREKILNDVIASGTLIMKDPADLNTFFLDLDTLSARSATGRLSLSGTLRNFRKPWLSMATDVEMDFSEISDLALREKIHNVTGKFRVSCTYENRLPGFKKLTPADFTGSRTKGDLILKEVDLHPAGSNMKYENISGTFRFNNNDVRVEGMNASFLGMDFRMSGHFVNILPWIFFEEQPLDVNATFSSAYVDLDKILDLNRNNGDTSGFLNISDNIHFTMDARLDSLRCGKFSSGEVRARLICKGKRLFIEDAHLEALGGKIDLSGTIDATADEEYTLQCQAGFRSVDISRLFYEFGEFAQDNITSQNLKGRLDADVSYASGSDPQFRIHLPSLIVAADLEIANGELIGYSPLYSLSGFIRQEELQHIRFSSLKNKVFIRDEKVIIPSMDIRSSSLDLTLEGEHTFTNRVDYHVWVLLKDMLHNGEKEEDFEKDYEVVIEDDGYGRTMLPLHLSGPAADPEIKYDRQAVARKWSDDLKKEKENLKELIRSEFGKSTNREHPTPVVNGDESSVILEWEEDTRKKEKVRTGKQSKRDEDAKYSRKPDSTGFIFTWDEEADTLRKK